MKARTHVADFGSYPVDIVGGEGCFLIGSDGKRYIDFLGGWCVSTLGWKHSKIQAALSTYSREAFYVPPLFRWQGWETFAKLLTEIAPGKLTRAFRCTSGSEAVEFAIKIARAAAGRKVIVSLDKVYHGHTYGAASVGTGLTSKMAPGVPGFEKLPLPDEYRNPYNLTGSALSDAIVSEFEKLARSGEVAAFLSEPIFTNAGAVVPPADFYPKIAKVCRQFDILLVMDEVASGFGRTGKLFASEHWGLEPDIVCLGKGISGGYATIAATLTTEDVFEGARGIPAYSTFGWAPTDLAIARANVETILEEKLWENSAKMGDLMLEKLKPLEALAHVGLVRGKGLLFGVEIVRSKSSKEPDETRTMKVIEQCLRDGLLIDNANPGTLFFTPPLILDEKTAEAGVDILTRVVEKVC